jgi:adenosine deaminase
MGEKRKRGNANVAGAGASADNQHETMPTSPADFFQATPKVDLHRHLEGSIRLSTLIDVAREFDIELPDLDKLGSMVQVTQDDPHTSQNFLSKFEVLRQFYRSPEVITRITEEAIADAAADNVKYLELRFTPSTLARSGNYPLGEVMDWVITATLKAQAEYGVTTRLIVSVNRHESTHLAAEVAHQAADRLDSAIVGLDLAGDEANFPAVPFAPIFQEARQAGLKSTIHAAEWGPAGNIAQAIDLLEAERIGHGVRVLEDQSVAAMARERNMTFEVCVTSNYQSGVVAEVGEHPFKKMIEAGLNPTINTDDPAISGITLSSEYALVGDKIGLTQAELQKRITAAVEAAFIPAGEREKLAATLGGISRMR